MSEKDNLVVRWEIYTATCYMTKNTTEFESHSMIKQFFELDPNGIVSGPYKQVCQIQPWMNSHTNGH